MPDVLERFTAGDPDAIREIYREYSRPVFTVAVMMTRDDALAADVVQQTFVKAWKNAASFDSTRDLAPWLYTIARRTAIDLMRTERRPTQGGHEPEVDGVVEPLSFERTWEAHEVRAAIDQLDPGEADLIRLAYDEGWTQAEIAAQTGLPIGTVKSRMFRAQKRLAVALGHLAPERNRKPGHSVENGEDS
ncbi:MAG: sigma-70 family RNA polymerase sigma factor [Actinomycetota bacterium]